jgi:hypothetical protein
LSGLDLGTLKIKIGVDNSEAEEKLNNTGSKISSFGEKAG